jgi:Tetratricopeptide repeat
MLLPSTLGCENFRVLSLRFNAVATETFKVGRLPNQRHKFADPVQFMTRILLCFPMCIEREIRELRVDMTTVSGSGGSICYSFAQVHQVTAFRSKNLSGIHHIFRVVEKNCVSHYHYKMSANYLAVKHSSLQTPFWESLAITPNLKYAVAQAFPDDDVPEPSIALEAAEQTGDVLNHSKLLAVKDLFVKTVAEREQSLPPSDKLRFNALHTLGMICTELGQWEEAEKVYNRLIIESDKVFGLGTRQAAGAVSNLGNVYEHLGKYKEAEITFRQAKDWAAKNLGEESPQYLGAIRGLIGILKKEGKVGEAKETLSEGLAIVERMSGPFKEEETEEMQFVAEKLGS